MSETVREARRLRSEWEARMAAGGVPCHDGHNDPPSESLFRLVSSTENSCSVCGASVGNCTEARDAHLNEAGCHA